MAWLKLSVYPEHPKILRIAELTGDDPEHVFACVVRWFRHVDEHVKSPTCGVTPSMFHAIVKWSRHGVTRDGRDASQDQPRDSRATLCDALQDRHVEWLRVGPDGTLEVPEFEAFFGQSAKIRTQAAERQARRRQRLKLARLSQGDYESPRVAVDDGDGVTSRAPVTHVTHQETEKEKEKETPPPPSAPAAPKTGRARRIAATPPTDDAPQCDLAPLTPDDNRLCLEIVEGLCKFGTSPALVESLVRRLGHRKVRYAYEQALTKGLSGNRALSYMRAVAESVTSTELDQAHDQKRGAEAARPADSFDAFQRVVAGGRP